LRIADCGLIGQLPGSPQSEIRDPRLPRVVRTLLALLLIVVTSTTAFAANLKVVETKHYTLHTDVEPALAKDLAIRLDAMYEEYDRRLADFKTGRGDERAKFEVFVFNDRADYMQLTENRLANTGGVFIPHRNLLAAFLQGQGRDTLRRTLQHEAFHQFAFRSISRDLPPWLNEGLAQLFEEGIWTGKAFLLNQVPPRRVRQLQADVEAKRLVPFDKFLAMTLDQWNQTLTTDAELGGVQYNQAWAMVHFLVYAGTEKGGKAKYRDRLLELLKKTNAGVDPAVAFTESFSNNVEGFQDRFSEYARALRPTSAAAMLERQSVLADLLKVLHRNNMKFSDVSSFRARALSVEYRATYTMGNVRWETDPNVAVYFSGLDGKLLKKDALFFVPRAGAPLPDIVCRPGGATQIRSRFHRTTDAPGGGDIEHEILVEPVK
jgi:hypothetical protein